MRAVINGNLLLTRVPNPYYSSHIFIIVIFHRTFARFPGNRANVKRLTNKTKSGYVEVCCYFLGDESEFDTCTQVLLIATAYTACTLIRLAAA